MRKRFRIGLAIIIAAFIGAMVWQFSRPQPNDPVYQGKPLSVWLKGIEFGDDEIVVNSSLKAVAQIGTNALPMLLTMIQTKNSWGPRFSSFAWFVHNKVPFIPVPEDPGWKRRVRAAAAFYVFGHEAKPAIPALSQILFKNPDNHQAEWAIICVGKDAIPVLMDGLTNSDPKIVSVAFDTLGNMSSGGYDACSIWDYYLNRTNERIRLPAMSSLEWFPQKSDWSIPVLTHRVHDTDPRVRMVAIVSLGRFGPAARTAMPAIQNALNDPDQIVRIAATNALKQIDPDAAAKAGVK